MKKNKLKFLSSDKRQSTYLTGFTLVELLVVATIIIILTVTVVVNLDKARTKSRDTQRKADISSIAAAVEMYKAENKVYPVKGTIDTSYVVVSTSTLGELVPYLPVFPVDPVNRAADFYEYKYLGDAGQYKVKAKAETIKPTATETCSSEALLEDAKMKAGEFFNPADPPGNDCRFFVVYSSSTASMWESNN